MYGYELDIFVGAVFSEVLIEMSIVPLYLSEPTVGPRPGYPFTAATRNNNSYKANNKARDFKNALARYTALVTPAQTNWDSLNKKLQALRQLRKEEREKIKEGNTKSAAALRTYIESIEETTDPLLNNYKKKYIQTPSVFNEPSPLYSIVKPEKTFYQKSKALAEEAKNAELRYLREKQRNPPRNAAAEQARLNAQAASQEAYRLIEKLQAERAAREAAANPKAQGGSRKRSARSKRKTHRRKSHRRKTHRRKTHRRKTHRR